MSIYEILFYSDFWIQTLFRNITLFQQIIANLQLLQFLLIATQTIIHHFK